MTKVDNNVYRGESEGKVVEGSVLVFANNAVANTFVLGGVSSFGVDHPCKKYTWCSRFDWSARLFVRKYTEPNGRYRHAP
eukprot:1192753-Prorocentrum_minimum.AAC.1